MAQSTKSLKLKCDILATVSATEAIKFWKFVFQKLSSNAEVDSVTFLLAEHGFYFVFGVNGKFLFLEDIIFEVQFKQDYDEWADGILEAFDDDDDQFFHETQKLILSSQKWYFNWISTSFTHMEIRNLRAQTQGNRVLSLYTCDSEEDFEHGQHRRLQGTKKNPLRSKNASRKESVVPGKAIRKKK